MFVCLFVFVVLKALQEKRGLQAEIEDLVNRKEEMRLWYEKV